MTNDNNGFLASRTQSWMNSFCVRLPILSIFSRQALRLAPLQQKMDEQVCQSAQRRLKVGI
jgi:hypothetical protein